MILPQLSDYKWKSSPTDPLADLVATRGVDLSRPSHLAIGRKPIVLQTNGDDSQLGLLLSVQSDESNYYFVTNDGCYKVSSFSGAPAFTKLATSGMPNGSLGRDAVMFNGSLNVGGGDVVKYYASNVWSNGVTSGTLDSTYPIRLENFANKRNLAVGNGNKVRLYDTSYALQITLTLPPEFVVSWMKWRQNNLYIGTRNISGGGAMMFQWNGASTDAQFGYGVLADWMYAGCEYGNGIAVITSAGQLLKFDGTGFDEIANLPVYNTPYSWSSSASLINGTGKVSPRGMSAIGKRLLISLDGSISVRGGGYPGVHLPEQPSGIWEYNPDNGLHHKAGFCHTKYRTLTVTDLGTSRLVFGAAHGISTGDAVFLASSGSLTGVVSGQTYFAIADTTTTIMLSLSAADALAGKFLTVGGTAGGASLNAETSNEVGATYITAPGAIGLVGKNLSNVFFGTTIFFGAQTPDDTGTSSYAIQSFGLGRTRSAAVTREIPATSITDNFKKLIMVVASLAQATDALVVKYRTRKSIATQVSTSGLAMITWTSSSAFTAPAQNRDLSSVAVGDEMTVIQGAGAGYTAHVASVSLAAGVWTVTLDETFGNITGGKRSEVQFDNWTKAGTAISNTSPLIPQNLAEVPLEQSSSWIQLKIELRGRGFGIPSLTLTSAPLRNL